MVILCICVSVITGLADMLPSKTVIKQKLEFWEEGVGYVNTTAMSGVTDFSFTCMSPLTMSVSQLQTFCGSSM